MADEMERDLRACPWIMTPEEMYAPAAEWLVARGRRREEPTNASLSVLLNQEEWNGHQVYDSAPEDAIADGRDALEIEVERLNTECADYQQILFGRNREIDTLRDRARKYRAFIEERIKTDEECEKAYGQMDSPDYDCALATSSTYDFILAAFDAIDAEPK